ncbi:hypothetical protein HID58_044041 [Brassica napus]|uniref:Uncharacterized protein n=1 Tax=Brassica napus TaxID=3708 RepID=A0ABQ8BJP4_BRANA|nr:hypothetical protein HID58_044041 [Brassica napus]
MHRSRSVAHPSPSGPVYGPEGRISQLYGRYGSRSKSDRPRSGRARRDQVELAGRADSRGEPTRVTAELAGEHNHATVQLAGKLTGELTCVTVQLFGEWLLCGIRSFVHF